MEPTPTTSDQLNTNALFTQYMNIVNRAMGEHRDEFPYKQLMSVGDKLLGGKDIGVAIYKSDPKAPHDWFTIRYGDGTFDIVEHGKRDDGIAWRVDEKHLRNVVDDPRPFVESPMKLDLDWLRTRLKRD